MLIAGAGGFARETLELILQRETGKPIYFYDEINPEIINIHQQFKVLKTEDELRELFLHDPEFSIGIGGTGRREKFFQRLVALGGSPRTIISPLAQVGKHGNIIGEGSIIATGTVITTGVRIGKGCLINLNCTIAHDTVIGNFCELSPGVHISGTCRLADHCQLGTGAVVLPGITLGEGVVIGAGVVVTHDVDAHCTVINPPARAIPISSSGRS